MQRPCARNHSKPRRSDIAWFTPLVIGRRNDGEYAAPTGLVILWAFCSTKIPLLTELKVDLHFMISVCSGYRPVLTVTWISRSCGGFGMMRAVSVNALVGFPLTLALAMARPVAVRACSTILDSSRFS